MKGTEILVFFVIVPIVAWDIEILVIQSAYEVAQWDPSSRGLIPPASRM